MNPKEKHTVAYHEAGHALIAELRETSDKVARVSIIPLGIGALGFTQQLPTEEWEAGRAVSDGGAWSAIGARGASADAARGV